MIGTEVGDYYNALLETTGKAYADKEQAKKSRSPEHEVA